MTALVLTPPSACPRHLDAGCAFPLAKMAALAPAVLVGIQIVAVVTFGVFTIQRYPLWSVVDEGAHFDNVVYVAAHGSYPVLGKTLATEQELAIGQGIYPRHTTINPRTYRPGRAFLRGLSAPAVLLRRRTDLTAERELSHEGDPAPVLRPSASCSGHRADGSPEPSRR